MAGGAVTKCDAVLPEVAPEPGRDLVRHLRDREAREACGGREPRLLLGLRLEERHLLSADEDAVANLERVPPGDALPIHEHAVSAPEVFGGNFVRRDDEQRMAA